MILFVKHTYNIFVVNFILNMVYVRVQSSNLLNVTIKYNKCQAEVTVGVLPIFFNMKYLKIFIFLSSNVCVRVCVSVSERVLLAYSYGSVEIFMFNNTESDDAKSK